MGGEHQNRAVARAGEEAVERRAHERRTIQRTSVLFFEPGDSSANCTVRNISAGGARVVLTQAMVLPEKVTLMVASGDMRRALVRWRIGLEAGLEFVG